MGLLVLASAPPAAGGGGLPADVALATAGTLLVGSKVIGDPVDRFQITADGTQTWGGGAIAADVTLARSGAGVLAVTGALTTSGDLSVRLGAATQVKAGAFGPASEAAITLGSAADTTLYRSAANVLRTAHQIQSAVDVTARQGAAAQAVIGAEGPASEAGIALGSTGFGKLYLDVGNAFHASTQFKSDGAITSRNGLASQVLLSTIGGNAAAFFGSLTDLALIRLAAGQLAITAGTNSITAPTMTGAGLLLENVSVAPSTNPVGGGVLYCVAGALTYRGTAGTVTTVAPA